MYTGWDTDLQRLWTKRSQTRGSRTAVQAPASAPPPANTAYQHKDLERILAAATVIRSSFLCLSLQIKYFTLKREVTCLAFIYSGTAVTQQSAPTLFPSRLKCWWLNNMRENSFLHFNWTLYIYQTWIYHTTCTCLTAFHTPRKGWLMGLWFRQSRIPVDAPHWHT